MAGGFFRCSLNRDFLCHQGLLAEKGGISNPTNGDRDR